MPLQVQPALPEDAATACAIKKAASETSPFDRIFFPQTPDDDTMQVLARRLASQIEESGREGGSCRAFKVVDTDVLLDSGTCEMIAFGKWKVERPTGTRDEVDDDDPDRFGPGSNVEACALAFDGMENMKRAHVGNSAHIRKQHATEHTYQRRADDCRSPIHPHRPETPAPRRGLAACKALQTRW